MPYWGFSSTAGKPQGFESWQEVGSRIGWAGMSDVESEAEIEVTVYGCRGSVPVCEHGFEEFGGNTTCFLLHSSDSENVGIIDAGTGIRRLGRDLMADEALREKPIVIAFTHFHWDHIQGLPFFEPAYVKEQKISLLALGRKRPVDDLERVFAVPMQSEYFPLELGQMGAEFEYLLPQDDTTIFPKSVVTRAQAPSPGECLQLPCRQGAQIGRGVHGHRAWGEHRPGDGGILSPTPTS